MPIIFKFGLGYIPGMISYLKLDQDNLFGSGICFVLTRVLIWKVLRLDAKAMFNVCIYLELIIYLLIIKATFSFQSLYIYTNILYMIYIFPKCCVPISLYINLLTFHTIPQQSLFNF